jgi:hypothetical protein
MAHLCVHAAPWALRRLLRGSMMPRATAPGVTPAENLVLRPAELRLRPAIATRAGRGGASPLDFVPQSMIAPLRIRKQP